MNEEDLVVGVLYEFDLTQRGRWHEGEFVGMEDGRAHLKVGTNKGGDAWLIPSRLREVSR